MNAHQSRRIDRRTAEQLLRGGVRTHGPDALGELLSAAAAPATEGELAGEQAAVAAFRAARPAPVPQLRRGSMIRTTLAKLLTVKIAAVAAGAVAAGGVALAAATGTLPSHPGGQTPAPPGTSHPAGTPTVTGSEHTTAADDKNTGAGAGAATASPSPSLVGLCQAYTSGAGGEHGKALENPAFTALITTAGGEDKVPGYCSGLLGDKATKEHENTHGAPPAENKRPAETHRTGAPATHPAGPPETRPNH
jgi:hypothetical protein